MTQPQDRQSGEWVGFCTNPECSCWTPNGFVCDEMKGYAGSRRCHECGWPPSVHDLRDQLAEAGLELRISAARVRQVGQQQ